MITTSFGWTVVAVLTDNDLSETMPEVFDEPPEIIAGFMAYEIEEALLKWNPLIWGVVMKRGLFVAGPVETVRAYEPAADRGRRLLRQLMAFLRRTVFDRFGRS